MNLADILILIAVALIVVGAVFLNQHRRKTSTCCSGGSTSCSSCASCAGCSSCSACSRMKKTASAERS